MGVRLRFAPFALACVIALLPLASAAGATGNPADTLVDLTIDDYSYDKAKDCRKRPTPGALAMVDWLERNAKGVFWGIMRCERWGGTARPCTPRPGDRLAPRRLRARRPPRGSPPDRSVARNRQRRQRARPGAPYGNPGDHLELPLLVVGGRRDEQVLGLLHGARKAAPERELHDRPQGPHPHRPLMGGCPKAHVVLGALARLPWAPTPRPRGLSPPAGGASLVRDLLVAVPTRHRAAAVRKRCALVTE